MSSRSRFLRRFIMSSILTGACVGATAIVALAEPGDAPASNGTVESAAGAPAGVRIHVDPQTGARTAPPPDAAAALAGNPAFSTSHQGLVEEPAPGGGMMIDLQGRFRSAASATVGADGKAHVDCVPPGTAARKE